MARKQEQQLTPGAYMPPPAITPEQAEKLRQPEDQRQLGHVMEAVNKAISNAYMAGRPVAISSTLFGKNPKVRAAALQKFKQAGWTITSISDQRDGNYYDFKAE